MKNYMAILFILLACVSGCAPRKYLIEAASVNAGFTLIPPVRIEFKDADTLRQNEIETAGVMLRKPFPQGVPPGGQVTVHIQTSTLGRANLDSWVFSIEDESGQEFFREAGKFDMPNYSSGNWWNLYILLIPKPINDFVIVHVFDKVMKARYDFKIRRNPEWKVPSSNAR